MRFIILLILFSMNAYSQDPDLIQEMLQECLSDSTFEHNLLHNLDKECEDELSYRTPYPHTEYLHFTFNERVLKEKDFSDSIFCDAVILILEPKWFSKYQVSATYTYETPIPPEHNEQGIFQVYVVKIVKVKKNGSLKILKSEISNKRIGTILNTLK